MSISSLVRAFDNEYFNKLNLIASENLTSHQVRHALQSDFTHRYALPEEKDPSVWDYPNQQAIREIREQTESLACELFHAAAADVAPLSGNQVALIMLTSLLDKGDKFLSVSASNGGHFATEKIAQERGYERLDIPYRNGSVDVDATAKLVKNEEAKLIFLDASMVLFPYPVRELREAVGDDMIISYDGSHTMGIIAGHGFQSPLEEGADFFHGSTHKSLWGPQKALIVSAHNPNDYEPANRVFSRIMPLFVSNAHPHHISALGVALEESKKFGVSYARDVIDNAHLLGQILQGRGLQPLFSEKSFTKCHQLILPLGSKEFTQQVFKKLEASNINANAISIPYSNKNEFGLRFGLSEITRRGLKGTSIEKIGTLITDIVDGRSVTSVRKEVIEISQAHKSIYYAELT